MILIGEILVSDELIKNNFVCDLKACKGACCIEGDYGAPLEKDEIKTIEDSLNVILPLLDEESRNKIESDGFHIYNEESKVHETSLMEDGACVFMGRNALGISYCTIEKAQKEGLLEFKKPISCHLYPVRVSKNEMTGFEALNYDRWDICSAACTNGNKHKVRIYEFVKEALKRKYGSEFYEALDDAAQQLG